MAESRLKRLWLRILIPAAARVNIDFWIEIDPGQKSCWGIIVTSNYGMGGCYSILPNDRYGFAADFLIIWRSPVQRMERRGMKQLMLTLVVALQAILFSAASAWSPLADVEKAAEKMHNCYLAAAGGEQDEEGDSSEDEDEEPDCD